MPRTDEPRHEQALPRQARSNPLATVRGKLDEVDFAGVRRIDQHGDEAAGERRRDVRGVA